MDKIRESIIDIVKKRVNYCDYNCVDITDDTDIVLDLGLDPIDVILNASSILRWTRSLQTAYLPLGR